MNSISAGERVTIFVALFLILVYLSPLIILGEDAHVRIHDNLDSNVAWYEVLARSHELFGPINSVIPQVINGLPRGAYGTDFSGIVWLHAILPTMSAYAISQTMTRMVAFIGMYVLLRKHFMRTSEAGLIRVGVSLAFSLTPFWPSGMLSTLGQPLALWAFLNIRNREHSWKDWATLVLLPFYSSFVLGFFFFLTAMGLLWLRDGLKKRDWNLVFLIGIALMCSIYLTIEYRLVLDLVFTTTATSRTEFVNSTLEFWQSCYYAIGNFIFGHSHVLTMHTMVILPVLFIALRIVYLNKSQQADKRFIFLLGLNLLLSLWYGFWYFKGWEPLKEKFTMLNTFNFARFHFLRPLVIYLGFALGLKMMWDLGLKWKRAVRFCLVLQVAFLFLCNDELVYRVYGEPSFKQFYAVEQFREIKNDIGLPLDSYRVASIGLHPAIAQYNGFYTLDTYNNYYPLDYKHKFRLIIAKELDKSPALKTYFDQWGGRCYLFVSELGKKYDFKKDSTQKIQHLELDMDAFRSLGGRFIFSSVPIENAADNQLLLKKVYDNSHSAWKIYLYEVENQS